MRRKNGIERVAHIRCGAARRILIIDHFDDLVSAGNRVVEGKELGLRRWRRYRRRGGRALLAAGCSEYQAPYQQGGQTYRSRSFIHGAEYKDLTARRE